MRKYKYLTIEQRRAMATMFQNKAQPKDISKALNVHLATVYREMKRCKGGGYDPEAVQRSVTENIKRRGRTA